MRTSDWLDGDEYPFEPHFVSTDAGRLHFIDEGTGEPVLFVHGNPTWSFTFRHLIKCLSDRYRCIAMDHLGFGLSEKPRNGPYRPEKHAESLHTLINELGLTDITLVVQDWGGPIGLSFAVSYPEAVKRIVLINSWMWPLDAGGGLMNVKNAFLGFRIKRFNTMAKKRMKKAVVDKARFTGAVHRHFTAPLAEPKDREGCRVLAGLETAKNPMIEWLWSSRDRLRSKPALILWGMKDKKLKLKDLERWISVFGRSRTVKFASAGRYVQEDLGAELCPIVLKFMEDSKSL